MPCGGIGPIPEDYPRDNRCWMNCGREEPCDHFIEEWDDFIHYECIPAFLLTEEGKCMLSHEHTMVIQKHKGDAPLRLGGLPPPDPEVTEILRLLNEVDLVQANYTYPEARGRAFTLLPQLAKAVRAWFQPQDNNSEPTDIL